MRDLWNRLFVSFGALLVVLLTGTFGYHVLGDGRWSMVESLYMTVQVITTLGIETLDGYGDTPTRVFTMLLLLSGIGTFLYFASSLTAFILESDLREVFRRRRMQKHIDSLSNHVIVCGAGRTGRHVVRELIDSETAFVVIDHDEAHLKALYDGEDEGKTPHVVGDATDDEILLSAGLERARALVAALHDDKQNLYVVVTARDVNPGIRIVTKAIDARAADKLRKAGADSVVSTTQIGAHRLASEVLRPHVTEFLEEMLNERDIRLRIEEVHLPPGSPMQGKTLRDAHIRSHSSALVLAIRDGKQGTYTYNPGPDEVLHGGGGGGGGTLIVLLPLEALPRLRKGVEYGWSA